MLIKIDILSVNGWSSVPWYDFQSTDPRLKTWVGDLGLNLSYKTVQYFSFLILYILTYTLVNTLLFALACVMYFV